MCKASQQLGTGRGVKDMAHCYLLVLTHKDGDWTHDSRRANIECFYLLHGRRFQRKIDPTFQCTTISSHPYISWSIAFCTQAQTVIYTYTDSNTCCLRNNPVCKP